MSIGRNFPGVAAAALLLGACTTGEPLVDDTALLPPLDDSEAQRCISIPRIASVNVLDRQNIEFKMRGGDVYINILPHPCPGLRANQPFMYRTSLSVLCDLDLITVLDTGGFGYRPMGSCGLGRFHPVVQGGPAVIGDDEDQMSN